MEEKKGTVLNIGDEGNWFSFFESSQDMTNGDITYADPVEGAGQICIRDPQPFWVEKAGSRKKKAEFVLNPKSRAMERVEYDTPLTAKEEAQERDDSIDFMVVSFKDFYDKNEKPIKCTRENKLVLMSVSVFARCVGRCLELSRNEVSKRAEVIEKN